MNNYTNEERVFMVKTFYSGVSLRRVRDLFAVAFNTRPIPSASTIQKYVEKFENQANISVESESRGGYRQGDDRTEEQVLAMINADPTYSLRQISHETGLCKSRVWMILKKYKYHPYKPQCHQEIFYVDEESRSAFCYEIQERANNDRRFLSSICFTDECTFTLNNEPNVQNTRHWAQENPRLNISTRTQYPQKINIWAGIFNHNIIGPFEIEGNLNSETYLDLLVTKVGPALEDVARENQEIWFQQDGCPAHFGLNVRHFLNNSFPNHWIGRSGTINWPARSPDLAPCDFFLWGHLKSKIYKRRHPDINSLREAIVTECALITNRELANVRNSFYNRLGYCLAQNGGLFEYLL
ncbi:uncharacterized protein LOC116181049 [Photinus pyralis]|nr:uncharacterized protein LOC116160344 [Photinus pyralis]XP_031330765.1 uncharacterized protein LOC116161510 [Photinus pyralis]XP_031332385.1 uncharacterized protein LOC116162810 [Photinus pyralis]XP_031332805.1 uncharacterized protein LOC116163099 [Photinus pyralis]XP_031334833.1 uncharacterized protein LOC116164753 [Photinus pyralis]XP_031334845.1 uncharacterized protein LOC116164766 [Photinus pyralis]XP_031336139.1 uncharacterized protein LOC116165659 [Photinus pyralis]XP_031336758.1 unc